MTRFGKFGIPLDSRHTYTKSDWQIWTAAAMSDTSLRDRLVSSMKRWLSSGASDAPMTDWYETLDGKVAGFRARPVAGGHRECHGFAELSRADQFNQLLYLCCRYQVIWFHFSLKPFVGQEPRTR